MSTNFWRVGSDVLQQWISRLLPDHQQQHPLISGELFRNGHAPPCPQDSGEGAAVLCAETIVRTSEPAQVYSNIQSLEFCCARDLRQPASRVDSQRQRVRQRGFFWGKSHTSFLKHRWQKNSLFSSLSAHQTRGAWVLSMGRLPAPHRLPPYAVTHSSISRRNHALVFHGHRAVSVCRRVCGLF